MDKLQKIVNSRVEDLKQIARCHIAAFPHSLSSKLGLSYCTKMLEWYLVSDNKFLFHILVKGEVAGYCGGFIRKGELYGSSTGMTQHASKAGIRAIVLRPWLLLHPKLRQNYKFLWRNFLLFLKAQPKAIAATATINIPKELTAGLVVIGVNPKYQGQGYGSILLKEFEKKSLAMHCSRLILTVESSNASAILAYERNGWSKEEEKDEHLTMLKLIG